MSLTLQPDSHPLAVPGHPQTPDGKRLYDPGCFWCREITAQPPPTVTANRPAP